MTQTITYVTKQHLLHMASQAKKWRYNRQIRGVNHLPDLNFPVVYTIHHEHRRGMKCESHMRLVIAVFPRLDACSEESTHLIVDVPIAFYNKLPKVTVTYPQPDEEHLP